MASFILLLHTREKDSKKTRLVMISLFWFMIYELLSDVLIHSKVILLQNSLA